MKTTVKTTLFALCLFCTSGLMAQGEKLEVKLSDQQVMPKDTLDIECNYSVNGVKPKVATLFLKIVNDKGQLWDMRWPLLDGYCNPALIIPPGFEPGGYRLYFSVMNNFFTVAGTVKKPEDVKEMRTIMITSKGDWISRNIPVREDGHFELRNQLFEKEATLMFQKKSGSSDDLDIDIETVLDSVVAPAAVMMAPLFVGPLPEGVTREMIAEKMKQADGSDSLLAEKTQMLQAVTVYGKKMSRAEKYSEQFSAGLFRSPDEKLIDVMDDPNALASNNVLQFLTGRVAGLYITGAFSLNPSASWRGGPVLFYLDQMPIDIQNLNSIPVSDIAIVKAFPPQFMGNPLGNGGAVAVYTKRGDFSEENRKHTFKVKGYTPMVHDIAAVPDRY